MDRKPFAEFKFLDGEPGGFEGYASLFGVRDAGNDVVERGAYSRTLAGFLKDGFISLGHDWDGLPIGIPDEAYEDDKGLFIRTRYHSTAAAQDARKVAQERMAAGKSVGLSIGYMVAPGGATIKEDEARHLTDLDLFEIGQVNVPMLRPAGLTSIKATWSAAFINSLPDSAFAVIESGGEKDDEGRTTPRSLRHFPHHGTGGDVDLPHLRNALSRLPQSSLSDELKGKAERHLRAHAEEEGVGDSDSDDDKSGLRLTDHEQRVRLLVPTVTGRWKALVALLAETKEGRAISSARRERLGTLRDVLRSGADELDGLLTETAPPEKAEALPPDLGRLFLEYQQTVARLQGVAA